MELVDRVAEAVPYEGYLLYPYRRSAMRNQQRWQFGGVYPEQYSQVTSGTDPWTMQTECLVSGDDTTTVEVRPRFPQVVDRRVAEIAGGVLRPVETLRVGGQVYGEWEEATERTVVVQLSEPVRAAVEEATRIVKSLVDRIMTRAPVVAGATEHGF